MEPLYPIMRQLLLRLSLSGCLLLFGSLAHADDSLTQLNPFLKQHCFACHGPEKQKGDIRFDTLGKDLSKVENLEIWQGMLDQLNLGEMPPKKQPRPMPTEIEGAVEALTRSLALAYEKARSNGGQTVLRRLNRHELRNTFRDLLYLHGAEYSPDAAGSRLVDNNGNGSVERTGNDPLRFFPEDEEEDGFFNLGDKLVMSDFLLKLTLGAVEDVLGQATRLEPSPKLEKQRFAGHLIEGKGQGEHPVEAVSREFNPDFDMMAKGYERYGRVSPTKLRQGVGVAARYRITIEASAHNGKHPYGEMIHFASDKDFQLCLNISDTGNGGIAGPTSKPLTIWS
ncbi:MAG: c-type cytochrome domain-containing protein, partial [Opitutales bacterium]